MALNIPINLNIENLAELNAQVAKMAGAAGGAGAGAAGRGPGAIGSLFGGEGGAGGATAKGLGQIAKQLPGAGMMGDMVGAFKSGGIIGVGMAGVAGILGFVKQIVESSKVFQGIAGSFFKIFGAMADMFLLPFLPLAMRGMQMLMQHLPRFQEWGQKTADWIGQFIADVQSGGFWNTFLPMMNKFEVWMLGTAIPAIGRAMATGAKEIGKNVVMARREKTDEFGEGTGEFENDYMGTIQRYYNRAKMGSPAGMAHWAAGRLTDKMGFGQGEQFSPTIKRGDQVSGLGAIEGGVGSIMNSMEVSLARQSEKVQNYATQFQQKEMGAGGMLGRWDEEVLRGSIPNTWDSISGMYRKMDDELADEAKNAEMLSGNMTFPEINPGESVVKLQAEVEKALTELSTTTYSSFVMPPDVAGDLQQCFIMANQCLNTQFTSLAGLVEGGVKNIQAGVGGDIFNLESINDLVTNAQGMGGAIATEATRLSGQVALMVQQMADPSLELTVDPKAIAAEIRQLQATIDAKVLSSANTIAAATANVNGLVDQWAHMANDWMDPSLGYGEQFGVLGAAYGEATGRAGQLYGRMKRWRIKRRTQIKKGGGGGGGAGAGVADVPTTPPLEPEMPPIFHPDEFEEEWGAPEAEIISIPDTGTGFTASEEDMDIFNDYVDARAEAITEAAMSTDMNVSRSMDWLWDPYGEQFGSGGGGGGRRGVQNTSHSVMNISINTRSSVQDILSDLRRVQHMDDASFFNSVS